MTGILVIMLMGVPAKSEDTQINSILVLISVAGFVLWEAGGRSLLCDIPLAAASEDVYPGTVLSEENLPAFAMFIQHFLEKFSLCL